jgi:hypothetical protein
VDEGRFDMLTVSLSHLTKAAGRDANNNLLWTQNFQYDAYGNGWMPTSSGLASSNAPATNVYNGNNQIGGGNYDAAGNQTVVNGDTIAYDAENRRYRSLRCCR